MSRLKNAIIDLLDNTKLTVEQAADKHFAKDFYQRVNGEVSTRQQFVQRMAELRNQIDVVDIEVKNELVQRSDYAQRHIVTLTMSNSLIIKLEVFIFGTLDNLGKFTQLEEISLTIPV